MKVTITAGADDRRMAKPADLVALDASLSTAQARDRIDAAGRMIAGSSGLRFEPWRQSYTLRLPGTDTTFLKLYSKPVTACSITDVDAGVIDDFTLISNGIGLVDRAERNGGWGRLFAGSVGISGIPDPESEIDAWIATVTAGWLMPGQMSTWAASTAYKTSPASASYDDPETSVAYARGAWVRATSPSIALRFECTTAGTSGATQPAAFTASGTAAGDTITDGAVTWTARSAFELPADLQEAALSLALATNSRRKRVDIEARSSDGVSVRYSKSLIPESILSVLETYR